MLRVELSAFCFSRDTLDFAFLVMTLDRILATASRSWGTSCASLMAYGVCPRSSWSSRELDPSDTISGHGMLPLVVEPVDAFVTVLPSTERCSR